jgi:hypothetical protein
MVLGGWNLQLISILWEQRMFVDFDPTVVTGCVFSGQRYAVVPMEK